MQYIMSTISYIFVLQSTIPIYRITRRPTKLPQALSPRNLSEADQKSSEFISRHTDRFWKNE
jgi:hypothetical protein